MGKSEVYLTSFDVSPVEYFDLMLDTVVQQEIHTSKDGLNMSVWRASDGPLQASQMAHLESFSANLI